MLGLPDGPVVDLTGTDDGEAPATWAASWAAPAEVAEDFEPPRVDLTHDDAAAEEEEWEPEEREPEEWEEECREGREDVEAVPTTPNKAPNAFQMLMQSAVQRHVQEKQATPARKKKEANPEFSHGGKICIVCQEAAAASSEFKASLSTYQLRFVEGGVETKRLDVVQKQHLNSKKHKEAGRILEIVEGADEHTPQCTPQTPATPQTPETPQTPLPRKSLAELGEKDQDKLRMAFRNLTHIVLRNLPFHEYPALMELDMDKKKAEDTLYGSARWFRTITVVVF
jgi:hypothetical protein